MYKLHIEPCIKYCNCGLFFLESPTGVFMNSRSKYIAVSAITLALVVVLGAIPFVFLVPLLFTCVTSKWKMTIVTSLFFGVVSLIYSFMGSTIVSLAFVSAPYIAIVPRIIVGIVAHGSYVLSCKIIKKNSKLFKILPISIATTLGCVTNTGLVVLGLWLFAPNIALGNMTILLYIPTMLLFGLIELIVCNIVVPPIALTIKKMGILEIKNEKK